MAPYCYQVDIGDIPLPPMPTTFQVVSPAAMMADLVALTDPTATLSSEPNFVTESTKLDPVEAKRLRIMRRHANADRLPTDRAMLLRDLLDASGVRDHDSAMADRRYVMWQADVEAATSVLESTMPRTRARAAALKSCPKPESKLGGMLDGFDSVKDGKAPCCLLEAFEVATRRMKTWRDVRAVLEPLSMAVGVNVHLPDDVITRHISQDVEIDCLVNN